MGDQPHDSTIRRDVRFWWLCGASYVPPPQRSNHLQIVCSTFQRYIQNDWKRASKGRYPKSNARWTSVLRAGRSKWSATHIFGPWHDNLLLRLKISWHTSSSLTIHTLSQHSLALSITLHGESETRWGSIIVNCCLFGLSSAGSPSGKFS